MNAALDRDRGGEIAGRLAQLYDYMLKRLLEANMHQSDPPLAEVVALLATLAEAWQGVCRPRVEAAPAGNVWSQDAGQEAVPSHGWSL